MRRTGFETCYYYDDGF